MEEGEGVGAGLGDPGGRLHSREQAGKSAVAVRVPREQIGADHGIAPCRRGEQRGATGAEDLRFKDRGRGDVDAAVSH